MLTLEGELQARGRHVALQVSALATAHPPSRQLLLLQGPQAAMHAVLP
jgi:hypothetical protein